MRVYHTHVRDHMDEDGMPLVDLDAPDLRWVRLVGVDDQGRALYVEVED